MKALGNTKEMARGKMLAIGALCIAVIAALGWLWLQYGGRETAPAQTANSPFRTAPGFSLKDASGKPHTLEEFSGKTVLVHFWASWCPPCLTEVPEVLQLARDFKGRPFEVIMVSLDDNWKDAQKALPSESLPSDMMSLLDPSLKTADAYGSYQFPETYLVDSKRRIVTKWVGAQNWKGQIIRTFLEKIISGSK